MFILLLLVPIVVEDEYLAGDGPADGAPVGQPLLRVAEGEAVALGGGVVLEEDGTEPVDDLLLHRHRARGGGVDDHLE